MDKERLTEVADRIERREAAVRKLRKVLLDLVTVNEDWNASVQTVIKKPPLWNDAYLDAARGVLEETKEFDTEQI